MYMYMMFPLLSLRILLISSAYEKDEIMPYYVVFLELGTFSDRMEDSLAETLSSLVRTACFKNDNIENTNCSLETNIFQYSLSSIILITLG